MSLFMVRSWLTTKCARDDRGANLVEYILLVSLIAMAVIAAVVFVGGQLGNSFNTAGSKLSNTPNP